MHVTFSFAFSSRYAKTRTFKFCKVVWQHTEGNYYMDFVGNLLLLFQQWKNFENRKESTKLSPQVWCTFFGTQCM